MFYSIAASDTGRCIGSGSSLGVTTLTAFDTCSSFLEHWVLIG